MIRIQQEDFSIAAEIHALTSGNPHVGAVVTMTGTVRDLTEGDTRVVALELEHYPGMTEKELEKTVAMARTRFQVEAVSIVHRVGRLNLGENIVLVVAAAAHRAAAFDACRFLIDHLKRHATFWKKEITSQGVRWVDTCPGCEAAAQAWQDAMTPDLQASEVHGSDVQMGEKCKHGHDHAHERGHDHAHAHACTHAHAHGQQGHPQGGVPSWAGLRVGILTLSDSRNATRDGSGDALEKLVRATGGVMALRTILPDDRAQISQLLRQWADAEHLDVVLTTGGTGPGPRDVTPEATRDVSDREMPGLPELIRQAGIEHVRSAVLTRGVAAIRGKTLIVNLPGSQRGAVHSFHAVADLVPHVCLMADGGGHDHHSSKVMESASVARISMP
ncbi:MAG: molybdenum cofactor biosynthesis protein MoaE [Magnetococcales bacterium]|nr:molybdenum cofactor biosynthesis protein MoaE [Magnetococcales bacterium]